MNKHSPARRSTLSHSNNMVSIETESLHVVFADQEAGGDPSAGLIMGVSWCS